MTAKEMRAGISVDTRPEAEFEASVVESSWVVDEEVAVAVAW